MDNELLITNRTGAFVLGKHRSEDGERLVMGQIIDAKKVRLFAYSSNEVVMTPPISFDLSENKSGDFSGGWTIVSTGQSGFAHFEPMPSPLASLVWHRAALQEII